MNQKILSIFNSCAILIVCSILMGAFYFQFGLHEDPCPLCLLQRMGMIGVILGLAMNIQFGFNSKHFGIVIIAALVGFTFSSRQVLLHICPSPDEAGGYGSPIMGMYLYSWGVLIFLASILGSAIFLLFIGSQKNKTEKKVFLFEKIVFFIAAIITLTNFIATYFECFFGPCCENGPCP